MYGLDTKNETIYGIKNTHIQQNRPDQPLRLSNSWQQHVRMEKLAENDLTYFYLRHVVIVVRDRPFNLKGGGYGILFRSEFFFEQHKS